MRDAHRMKDKLDLSLDSRQIASLAVAGMVVVGAVFVLGVVVGKKLSEADRGSQGRDLLATLDEKAAAMQKANEEPALTFQKTLTEKAPPPEPSAKPAPAAAAAAAPAPAPVPASPAAAKPEPKPAPEPEAKPETADLLEEGTASKGTIPPTAIATRTAPADAQEADRAKTVKLATPSPRAAAQVPAPAPAPAPAQAAGGWTLQLHASQEKADADRFAASIREKGYAPYSVTAEVPGRGTWHRVRLGNFPSKEAAGKYLADFKRETGLDAFVAPR